MPILQWEVEGPGQDGSWMALPECTCRVSDELSYGPLPLATLAIYKSIFPSPFATTPIVFVRDSPSHQTLVLIFFYLRMVKM
jgi:hypothetical protein